MLQSITASHINDKEKETKSIDSAVDQFKALVMMKLTTIVVAKRNSGTFWVF